MRSPVQTRPFLLISEEDEQMRFEMREGELMLLKTPPSYSWWFGTKSPKRSPWLHSTLSELDKKTKAMLKLIEEEADSFSQRAEMYYKKRPELVSIVKDFYRTHRSLAERYDQLKSVAGTRLTTTLFEYPLLMGNPSQKLTFSTDIFPVTLSDCFESEDSEVDDPEEEECQNEEIIRERVSSEEKDGEVMKLREEVERLKEENGIQKVELMEKDEEKREAIRQLCLSLEMLKEENFCLRRSVQESKKRNVFEFSKWKESLSRKIFGGFANGSA
eukprot:TRINITY_DN7405_c0_g1_i1.p1 TRINITY_DN7405_c0_g1~~TRINITY_DN7405_c0_g1_i1.p1  ORF type:complete len:273 (+),score=66.96 TRINITY_DN7405_c0_g1_i1:574-1392(+)